MVIETGRKARREDNFFPKEKVEGNPSTEKHIFVGCDKIGDEWPDVEIFRTPDIPAVFQLDEGAQMSFVDIENPKPYHQVRGGGNFLPTPSFG